MQVLTAGATGCSRHCSEKYANLIIGCGSAAFKVHKIILCSRCAYFEKLCDGNWKVFIS